MPLSFHFALLTMLCACSADSIVKQVDSDTIEGSKNYLKDFVAINNNNTINIVVEIPAGTTQKWELSKKNPRKITHEFKDGSPRNVKYLGYPGNYGFIPSTLLPHDKGGDGDPLDVVLLGTAVERGSIQQGRLIGVIELLDNGEQDDKLIAVPLVEMYKNIHSIEDLNLRFPAMIQIIKLWFENYKGKGIMQFKRISSKDRANEILHSAMRFFSKYSD